MKRTTTISAALLAALLLVSASVAGAGPGKGKGNGNGGGKHAAKKLTQQQCKAERKADKRAFKAVYGKRAMRTCKKGEKAETRQEIRNAAQQCKAERRADPDAFKESYGTGKKGRNAHGKCVSSTVREEQGDDVESFRNAARECKSERRADSDGFRATYGKNRNGMNAFGKCVSSKVGEDEETETTG